MKNICYDGYEKNYQKLRPKLKRPDLIQNACRLGAKQEGDSVRIAYLGREYIISSNGVEPADGLPASSNIRSTLIFYATSDGAGELTGEFALLSRLTGLIDGHGQNLLTGSIMSDPLIRAFGNDYPRFASAMTALGGEEQKTQSTDKHVWRLSVLPKILMQFVFYKADDEFPVDIQIMFDTSAPKFLEFECLAFLSGTVVQALINVLK